MKRTHCNQQGFTLLEGLVALGVLMSLLVLGSHYVQRRLDDSFNQSAATHLRAVATAASCYAQTHYAELQPQSATPLTPEQLKQAGYLPNTFSEKNIYRQHSVIAITPQNAPVNRLQILVLTQGGQPISERSMRQIAGQLGGAGGYISNHHPEQISGSQQGWQLSLDPASAAALSPDALALLDAPSAGHMASLSYLNAGDRMNPDNLLHRRQMPEHQVLNQMETDLTMHHHQIIFKKEDTNGGNYNATLDAHGIHLKHSEKAQAIAISLDKQKGIPTIEVKDAQGSVILNAEKVTTTSSASFPHSAIQDYSPAELHAHWNKVPYYELSPGDHDVRAVADHLCCLSAKEHDITALGRLFMLGQQTKPLTELYICGHGLGKPATAYLIYHFKPVSPMSSKRLFLKVPTLR